MLSRHLTNISKRAASAVAAKAATESVTTLSNGLTVATVDQHGAASQIVVAFRAGSRYETVDNQGVVNLLRNSIGTSSEGYPGFQLVWNANHAGGEISATSTRDVFAVRVAAPRDSSVIAASLLGELSNPKCEPWEILDIAKGSFIDAVYRCKWAATVDNLHSAAYRSGSLANSNFASAQSLGQGSVAKKAAQYKEKFFRAGNAVVFGVNVDHNTLVDTANSFRFAEGKPSAGEPSKYLGGDVRHSSAGPTTIVAIAGEGASLSNVKDVATQNVAAEILTTIAKKAGASSNGAVNVSYADSGLLGIVFSAENSQIGQVTKAVASAIKNAKADDAAVAVARRVAALKILTAAESSANLAVDGAVQILTTGNAVSPSDFADIINNVSTDAVNKAFSKLSSKLSLSALGSIREVPYADEL